MIRILICAGEVAYGVGLFTAGAMAYSGRMVDMVVVILAAWFIRAIVTGITRQEQTP